MAEFNPDWMLNNMWFFDLFTRRTIPEILKTDPYFTDFPDKYQQYFGMILDTDPMEFRKRLINDWLLEAEGITYAKV